MLAVFTLCFAATAGAQATVKGTVVDADSNEPLIGATVTVGGTSLGTVTDYEGNFTLKVTSAKATIEIKYLGYLDKSIKLTQQGEVNWGVVKMNLDTHTLGDVVVTSSIAVARKTPVAVSTVAPEFIEEKLGTMEFPEILKSTPGVYATKQGGGYGDSDINLRGFKTENIAVMVNGVPVNDMEWGGVYFSNWAGLSDVTRSTQVQRGLGASKVSVPSVGGSLNIVTRSTDAQKGGSISYGMGNDGMNSILFSVSTGLMKGGWAVSLLGGKKWGDGYIQGTDFEGYNYFLNVSKKLNDAHQLSFTAFGAPQSHYQRSSSYDGLTIQGWQEVKKYMEKISGPLIDRIDLCVHMNQVTYFQLEKEEQPEDSLTIKERVNRAVQIQRERYANEKFKFNSQLSGENIKKYCKLNKEEQHLMEKIYTTMDLSIRAYDKIIKVARTIADLDGENTIKSNHIVEAFSFRKTYYKYFEQR